MSDPSDSAARAEILEVLRSAIDDALTAKQRTTIRRARTGYRRREPENGALHRIVREQLERFLALVARDPERSPPRFVERELRAFLDCGVLQKGFARVRCEYHRWAELLQRVFAFEVLTCDACKGPRKIVAFITQPSVIRNILEHCGLAPDEVLLAPARSPPGCEEEFFA
ncbi:MAG: hypothetical protein H6832_17935 [Planctomycetes bacterium]|nr:hypothetical protein [Planctomycetota bacterium]MCB9920287.1 hypothetical protein [Planctomycetota bacterium]